MDSDSKINSPFFRGFRRENSDFFPLTSRHSAIFVDRNANPLRSSGIFNNRRGSDVGINKKNMGEPILTDFIKKNLDSPTSTSSIEKRSKTDVKSSKNILQHDDVNLLKPRREKTESDIVLRHSEVRRGLRESLEARRKDIESQFLREVDIVRRRNSRLNDVNSLALSTATNSIDGEEYLYLKQVILTLVLFFLLGA